MKTFTATHSHAQNNLKEHSPIYDLAAYQQRQRQLKRKKLRLKDQLYLILQKSAQLNPSLE